MVRTDGGSSLRQAMVTGEIDDLALSVVTVAKDGGGAHESSLTYFQNMNPVSISRSIYAHSICVYMLLDIVIASQCLLQKIIPIRCNTCKGLSFANLAPTILFLPIVSSIPDVPHKTNTPLSRVGVLYMLMFISLCNRSFHIGIHLYTAPRSE